MFSDRAFKRGNKQVMRKKSKQYFSNFSVAYQHDGRFKKKTWVRAFQIICFCFSFCFMQLKKVIEKRRQNAGFSA